MLSKIRVILDSVFHPLHDMLVKKDSFQREAAQSATGSYSNSYTAFPQSVRGPVSIRSRHPCPWKVSYSSLTLLLITLESFRFSGLFSWLQPDFCVNNRYLP